MNTPFSLRAGNTRHLNKHCTVAVSQGVTIISRAFESQIPFFYVVNNSTLWYSDNYPALVRTLLDSDISLSVSKNYIYDQLKFQAPLTSNTLFHPIKFLRVGEKHVVDTINGNILQQCFSECPLVEPLSPATFRELLQSELSDIVKEKTVFHLSSGLDSSLLSIIASNINGKGVKLASCKTRGAGASNELDIVERLAEDISGDLTIHDLTNIDLFEIATKQVKSQGYPVSHPSSLLEYALDSEIVGQGVTTIFNGKGPDDCLAGYNAHLDKFSVNSYHRDRLIVTKENELTNLFGGSYGEATNFWSQSDDKISLKQRMYYDARALTDSWNHIHNSVASGLKCTIKSPFMVPSIRNGLFALKDSQRIVNGKQKAFLRDTFSDLYPDYILKQPKGAFTLDLRPYFLDYSSWELREYLFDDFSILAPLLNIEKIDDMIESTLSSKRNFGWQLWSLFLCHLAIKEFGVNNFT